MRGFIPRDAAHPPKARSGKPKNRPKPNYKRLAYILLASTLVGCAGSYVLQTPALLVKRIEIKGLRRADRSEVEKAARTLLGRNIVLIRKAPVIQKIRALSEVSEVRMGRTFPNAIWVRIKEKHPAAMLCHRGKLYLLDRDGLAFHACTNPIPGIPVIRAEDCRFARKGARPASAGVDCALKIVECARKRQLDVAKISVDRFGDICLNMGSGLHVKLGQPDEIAKKLSLLKDALLYKPSLARDAAYINLSCPRAPVWKPKSSVGPAS